MTIRSLLLTLALLGAGITYSAVSAPPASAVEAFDFSCSKVYNAFKSAINAPDRELMKYAAFARGRAFTISGMKGCGYAYRKKSQAEADRIAMERCRNAARNPDKCYIALRYGD